MFRQFLKILGSCALEKYAKEVFHQGSLGFYVPSLEGHVKHRQEANQAIKLSSRCCFRGYPVRTVLILEISCYQIAVPRCGPIELPRQACQSVCLLIAFESGVGRVAGPL